MTDSAAAFQPQPAPQPPPAYAYSNTTVNVAGTPVIVPKDPTAAVLLELLPALTIQTFGIGNIYAGNILIGVLLMIAYWMTCAVNFALCFIVIGFITWPLTWLAFAAGSTYLAYQKAKSTRPTTG